MAVRVRKDGRILCAAMHPEELGDIYIHDGLHYQLSVELKVLLCEEHVDHQRSGEWWWRGHVPPGVKIDPWRLDQ